MVHAHDNTFTAFLEIALATSHACADANPIYIQSFHPSSSCLGFHAHTGECSTMSMVTQRSVERYARGSFLFTAFLEIALSTRRACVVCRLQMQLQSLQYLDF